MSAKIVPIHHHLPPTEGFRWRDQHGNDHLPREMETRHLFYTIRMIWNHSVPIVAQTPGQHRRYRFSSHHNSQYMAQAVSVLLRELLVRNRQDFQQSWLDDLEWIRGWIFAQEGEEIIFLSEVRRLEYRALY